MLELAEVVCAGGRPKLVTTQSLTPNMESHFIRELPTDANRPTKLRMPLNWRLKSEAECRFFPSLTGLAPPSALVLKETWPFNWHVGSGGMEPEIWTKNDIFVWLPSAG